MPNWLWRSIIGVSGVISLVAILQWGSCRFYVFPKVWPWYAKYIGTDVGKQLDLTPMGCVDADSKAITVLMGVMTTLISLSRKAD